MILKWTIYLSPYLTLGLSYYLVGPDKMWWIGFVIGCMWMFWTLAVGKTYREMRKK